MKNLYSILRIAAAAALFYGGQGLQPLAWMTWLAPLPLMLYQIELTSWRRALLEAFAAAGLGGLVWWPYLSSMAPAPVAALAILQAALVFSLGMVLMWLARRRERPVLATLMLPLTMVSCELLVATFSPHGTFGSIAYSQSDNLALMQVLSVAGLSGVTALLFWVPAAASSFWWQRDRAVRLAAPAFLVLALVVIFGQQRMSQTTSGPKLKVALLADDAQLRAFNKPGQEQQVLSAYSAMVNRAASDGARLVVLPEKTFTVDEARAPWLHGQLQLLSDRHAVRLLAGVNLMTAPKRNLAWLFQPRGEALEYQKRHLVPGWEAGFASGKAALLAQQAGMALGVAICKDLDFPSTMRAYRGRDLLIVPAWDFGADAWLHSRMALARGIEQGVPIARSAHEGQLTLSNAYGVVTHEASSTAASLMGEVVLDTVPTLYGKIGDAFGWALVAAWITAIVLLARTVARRRDAVAGK